MLKLDELIQEIDVIGDFEHDDYQNVARLRTWKGREAIWFVQGKYFNDDYLDYPLHYYSNLERYVHDLIAKKVVKEKKKERFLKEISEYIDQMREEHERI